MVKMGYNTMYIFPPVFVWALHGQVSNSNVLSSQQMVSMNLLLNSL